MDITENEFFSENLIKINKMISNFLVVSNIVPPLLILLTYLGLFKIEYDFSIKLFCVTVIFSIVDVAFIKFCANKKIPMYVGTVFLNLLITFMGTNARIGIYISYCFPPILRACTTTRG